MGIITLALIANGNLAADDFHVPTWVVVCAATRDRARAPTSAAGGSSRRWARRIIKMDPAQGFAAQGAGAAVILAASHFGYPLSTTHVISGGDHGRRRGEAALRGALGRRRQHRGRLGADAAGGGRDRRRWPTASTQLFGNGAAGPVVVVDRRGWSLAG